ncbi:hypothetical protein FACS1894205_5720 [Alphaproteobacteria bacterium]|nr:hypothetical protein FACS1894205_5720 [Alphaproteobacteria bacterium]
MSEEATPETTPETTATPETTPEATTPELAATPETPETPALTPESYGDLGMIDGEYDKERFDSFRAFAAENKVSLELAGKMVAWEKAAVEAQRSQFEQTRQGWVDEIKADKEFGGSNFEKTLSLAAKVLDNYSGPDREALNDVLNESKLGDHPALLRLFARIGRDISEDHHVQSGAAGNSQTTAELFFPSMKGA